MDGAKARTQTRIPGIEMIPGLEELNLVEFPLALLADTPPDGQKTLTYEDHIRDRENGTVVHRKVIVTGTDAFGLPNWQDIDVLLALMTLTNEKNRFSDRRVEFTLYELRELLRWPDDGRYHARLQLSLDRWCGLLIKFDHAWRKQGRWTTEEFGILDNVKLTRVGNAQPEEAQLLKWNDVVVESVQASNTKGLDWNFYISLKSPTAKRLYRFLDKRFGIGDWWNYELVHFGTDKIGLSPGQKTFRYRQRLEPAIAELERLGFLAPLPKERRFTKEGKGVYRVHFGRLRTGKARSLPKTPVAEPTGLEKELLDRDVRNAVALVSSYPEEKIREQIENFDDRNAHGESKGAGWLRKAIEDPKGYGFRKGYKTAAQREAQAKNNEARQQVEQKKSAAEKAAHMAERQRIEDYLNSLSQSKRTSLEQAAMDEAPSFSLRSYQRLVKQESPLAESVKRQIIANYVKSLLD